MDDFKRVRNNLLDMLEDLDHQLEDINQPSQQHTNTPKAHINTDNAKIAKIKHAISRIDNGTFGICLSCGETIKPEHLKTHSFSSYCIYCAKKHDNL